MSTSPEQAPARRHLSPRLVSVTLALLLCLLSWGGSSVPWGPLPAPGDLFSPVGGIWSVARQARSPAREQIQLPGLTGEVMVQVDGLGVPHVFATSDQDAALTLGYLHARERLAQMDLQRRLASGTLSALVGADGLDSDRLMRTVGLRRAAAASLEQMDPEEPALRVLEAYSAGVNAYLQEAQPHRLPLEYKLLGVRSVEPWTPLDSVTFGKFMAWELAHSWDDLFLAELVASLGPEVVDELYPVDRPYQVPMVDQRPPGDDGRSGIGFRGSALGATDPQPLTRVAAADILRRARAAGQLHDREFPTGSNNWAVAADGSSEGVPLLSSDPHLGYQLPSLWYQAHLVTPEMKVAGVTLVGMPFVAIGHTDRVAWGLTNTQADVVDYYVERTRSDEVWFEGAWRPLEELEEVIEVRGGQDESVTVSITPHGPILSERGQTVSMRWTGLDPSFEARAYFTLNHARSYGDFLSALRDFHAPAQNFAYADADGNVAIWAAGKFPIRRTGNGRLPVPAASGAYEWIGTVPFEELPHAFNPEAGYVFSANTRPAPLDYPYTLGWQWDPGYRGRRLRELLQRDEALSFNDMKAVQYDVLDGLARELVPILLEVYDERRFGGRAEAAAMSLLRQWDYQMRADSPAATLWRRWLKRFREMTWRDEFTAADAPTDYTWGFNGANRWQPTMEVFEYLVREEPESHWFDDITTAGTETRDDVIALSFAGAVRSLQEEYGGEPENWRWGEHHRLAIDHLLGLEPLGRGGHPMEGGVMTVNAQGGDERADGGPSWRLVVQLGEPVRAVGAYPGGQSGNPLSAHYDDLLPLWRAGDLPEMRFPDSPEAMPKDAIETTLTLRPGNSR